jgi:hypothetical protein
MKRDMDLLRAILIRIEEHDFKREDPFINKAFEGYEERIVQSHINLLYKAGFIEAMNFSSAAGEEYSPTGLTWEGHDFLDAARNDTVWNKVKTDTLKYGGGVPMEVLKDLLIKGTSAFFGLS